MSLKKTWTSRKLISFGGRFQMAGSTMCRYLQGRGGRVLYAVMLFGHAPQSCIHGEGEVERERILAANGKGLLLV